MKKIFCIFVFLISVKVAANAAPGDVIGNYYATDIVTTLNGERIDAVNIGGKTLICADDMHFYSFDAWWDPTERTLRVNETAHAANGEPPQIADSTVPSGTAIGEYYDTDIVTYIDGKKIEAYNTGGRTYIPAELLADYGFDVTWNEAVRRLDIVSPMRASYVYSVPLSFENSQTEQGTGGFGIVYDKGKLAGSGDVGYFDCTLNHSGDGYSIDVKFHQNGGLFFADALCSKLRPLAYCGYGVDEEKNPEDFYADAAKLIKISVNGYEAENISIISGAGNGHRDFYIHFDGVPKIRKDALDAVNFAIDEDTSAQKIAIEYPDYYTDGDPMLKLLKKNENDFIMSWFDAADFKAVHFCESKKLGVIKARLYIVSADNAVSADALDEVRKIDGFGYDKLSPFAYRASDDKKTLYFSCASPERAGDFSLDVESGKVELLASHWAE